MLKNRKCAYIRSPFMNYIPFLLLLMIVSASADPVVVSGGTPNDYESWIIRANDSRLMVIFCRNPNWQSGDLYVIFSTDDGISWESPTAIIESPQDQATLTFLQLPGDTFRLWYASNENITYGVYTAHSLDGIYWNRDGPVNLGWQVYDMHYDPTVIIEPDSSLTMSYRGPGGAYIAHKPHGGSWDTLRTLVGASGYRPRVMKHSDGTYLYAYHRNTITGYEVFIRTSLDRVNWTAELRMTFEGNSHDPFTNETTDGAYMLYYATHLPPAYNLYRRFSYDAINWEPEEQITFDLTNNTQPHFFAGSEGIYLVWAHAVLFPDDHDVYFERFNYPGIEETVEFTLKTKAEAIHISPNPCSREIRVTIPVPKKDILNIAIYDVQGRTISKPQYLYYYFDNVLTIGTDHLPTGVYLMRVNSKNVDYYKRFTVVR
ncbi:MAG: T9SS type A sorting domain-containing protein [candidate division WOR-3 bacterium]|nr:MAG: T9SS type A sorting domain-containing protein [candidate division WOR-3 bacterium]